MYNKDLYIFEPDDIDRAFQLAFQLGKEGYNIHYVGENNEGDGIYMTSKNEFTEEIKNELKTMLEEGEEISLISGGSITIVIKF